MKHDIYQRAIENIDNARRRLVERRRAFKEEVTKGARLTDHRFMP